MGIFFLVGAKVFVERTSLVEAGTYADCNMHEGDHVQYWDKLVRDELFPNPSMMSIHADG